MKILNKNKSLDSIKTKYFKYHKYILDLWMQAFY